MSLSWPFFTSRSLRHIEIFSRRRSGEHGLGKTIALHRDEIILNIATLCFFLTIHSVAPYLSQYAIEIGANETAVALLGPFFALSAMTLRPVSGILADRGWTRRLLAIGSAISAAAQIVFFAARDPGALYIGRFVQGAAVAIFIPASFQAAAIGNREAVISSLAWRSTVIGVSSAVGPAIGGYIAQHLGYRALFLLSTSLALSASSLSLLISSSRPPHTGSSIDLGSRASWILDRGFIAALVSLLLYSSAYSSLVLFLPAYHKERGLGSSLTAVFFTGAAASNLLSRVMFTHILRAIGVGETAILGLLLLSTGYILASMDPLSSKIAYYGIIAGLGMGMALPSLQVIAITGIPQGRRGLASAIYTMMFDLGNLTGPVSIASIARTYRDMIIASSYISLAALLPVASLQILGLRRSSRSHN